MKTSWRGFLSSSSEDVFKTSWSRVIYSSWSYVFKTPLRHLQDIFKTSSKIFFQTSSRHLQHLFETYCQSNFLQKDLSWSQFWEVYGQCTTFLRVNLLEKPKRSKQFFKTLNEVTASTNKYIIVAFGYLKRCCCLIK